MSFLKKITIQFYRKQHLGLRSILYNQTLFRKEMDIKCVAKKFVIKLTKREISSGHPHTVCTVDDDVIEQVAVVHSGAWAKFNTKSLN